MGSGSLRNNKNTIKTSSSVFSTHKSLLLTTNRRTVCHPIITLRTRDHCSSYGSNDNNSMFLHPKYGATQISKIHTSSIVATSGTMVTSMSLKSSGSNNSVDTTNNADTPTTSAASTVTAATSSSSDDTILPNPNSEQHDNNSNNNRAIIDDKFWSDLEILSQYTKNNFKPYATSRRCRKIVSSYCTYLEQLFHQQQQQQQQQVKNSSSNVATTSTPAAITFSITSNNSSNIQYYDNDTIQKLVSDQNIIYVLKCLLKCKYNHTEIAVMVRQLEHMIGKIGLTKLTDHLSLRLLTVNAKAGNIGRVIALLQLRSKRQYVPREREYLLSILAIQIASSIPPTLTNASSASNDSSMNTLSTSPQQQQQHYPPKRFTKNIFLSDVQQPQIDNPTRWLDAILINMKERNHPLTIDIVNRMLYCYVGGSNGGNNAMSGKSVHHFYRIVRRPYLLDNKNNTNKNKKDTDGVPKTWFYIPDNNMDDILTVGEGKNSKSNDDNDDIHQDMGTDRDDSHSSTSSDGKGRTGRYVYRPVKVQLKYNAQPPPFYKVPSQVKGKLLFRPEDRNAKLLGNTTTDNKTTTTGIVADSDYNNRYNNITNKPPSSMGQYRIEQETDPDFSITLTAAFAFADSIQYHGACGHDLVPFNTESYNALIRVCINRGSLWRAMHLLDNVMMSSSSNDDNDDDISKNTAPSTRPNIISYNFVLAGLARVGDVVTAQQYVYKLLDAGLQPDAYTVRAITDGLLNLGDVGGAVTVTQDFFNQYNILPPYEQHLRILEICLALDMVYEAKRYCYFIQQLWLWKPNPNYHDAKFIQLMQITQKNKQLQKPAIMQLFKYFGVQLTESDFL